MISACPTTRPSSNSIAPAPATLGWPRPILSPWNVAVLRERHKALAHCLKLIDRKQKLHDLEMLDVGCGNGLFINEMIGMGIDPGRVCGLDLFQDRIDSARSHVPASVTLQRADFLTIRPEAKYNLICLCTTLSSIPEDGARVKFLKHTRQHLKAGGFLLIYDFDRSRSWSKSVFVKPITTDVIATESATRLLWRARVTPSFFLGHRLTRRLPWINPILFWLPPLKTHFVGLFQALKGQVVARATTKLQSQLCHGGDQ